MEQWLAEDLPDSDSLFYRFPVGDLRANRMPFPGMFRENRGSISTDWEKYSTANETRARQGRPERFAVLRMIIGGIRAIDGLTVNHSPTQNMEGLPDNRAHSDVFGLELPAPSTNPDIGRKLRIRMELYKRFNTWEIPPGAPFE
jgi:hypothetical protein